jgi:hypothetical protein
MIKHNGKEIEESVLIGMLIAYVEEFIAYSSIDTIEQSDREVIIKSIAEDLLSCGSAVEWEL